ncbi:MAG: hypothetical protein HZY79_08855 [Rhodoblastus sp.]|nr:MAG: hypothetical protein HZY79_08855 [Rhodoblastus sp.]
MDAAEQRRVVRGGGKAAASLVMQRDKPDLIRMCDEIGGHVMLDTMESIGGTAKFLEAAAAIARSAANRMLVAAAASVKPQIRMPMPKSRPILWT